MLRDLICHVSNGDFALPRTHILKSVKISKSVKSKVLSDFYLSVLLRWFFFFSFDDWTEHPIECQVLVPALESKQSGPCRLIV